MLLKEENTTRVVMAADEQIALKLASPRGFEPLLPP